MKKICVVCGNEFDAESGKYKMCSNECRKINKRVSTDKHKVKLENKICVICNKEFKPKKHNSKVCSSRCKQESKIKLIIEKNGSFSDYYPEQAKFWDYERNRKKPTEVTKSSGEKYWFICENGHSFSKVLYKDSWCPYCSGKKVLSGFNDFETQYPNKAKYWDYEKNDCLPSEVTGGTQKRCWFICEEGHSFSSTITNIVHGNWCPYCSNRRVLQGLNDFESWYPDKAKYWDCSKNKLKPNEVVKGSPKKYWFICELGHSFCMSLNSIHSNGSWCPYCSNPPKKILSGFNDFETHYPNRAKYWDYEKNKGVKPSEVAKASDKKYWFICELGHSFNMQLSVITRQDCWCPYCSGHRVLAGFNDFETHHPEIMRYWDYKKNHFSPNSVSRCSGKKAYFICEKGHSFSNQLSNIHNGQWCPICAEERFESRLATYTKNLCKELFNDVETETPTRIIVDGVERILKPDILINDIMVHIEVHGEQHYVFKPKWHETIENFEMYQRRDIAKKEYFEGIGYKYIEIRVTTDFDGDKNKVSRLINDLKISFDNEVDAE